MYVYESPSYRNSYSFKHVSLPGLHMNNPSVTLYPFLGTFKVVRQPWNVRSHSQICYSSHKQPFPDQSLWSSLSGYREIAQLVVCISCWKGYSFSSDSWHWRLLPKHLLRGWKSCHCWTNQIWSFSATLAPHTNLYLSIMLWQWCPVSSLTSCKFPHPTHTAHIWTAC